MDYYFEDFTEEAYQELLKIARRQYDLIFFSDYRKDGKICLWRHDVDFSVHRALALAKIEFDENVRATYFLNLHSNFYNLLEKEINRIILKIIDLGHAIGLHFDPSYYGSQVKTMLGLEQCLKQEREILERLFNTSIHCFSFHTPDVGGYLNLDLDEIVDMVNAYGPYVRKSFGYCSDSNGYWRFRRLKKVLEEATDAKLQVTTHPSLWTPEVMAPRQRITRCIEGRARNQHRFYDVLLAECGRENIRHSSALVDWFFFNDEKLCVFIERLIEINKHHLAFIEMWLNLVKEIRELSGLKEYKNNHFSGEFMNNEMLLSRRSSLDSLMGIFARNSKVVNPAEFKSWLDVFNKLVCGDLLISKNFLLEGILYIISVTKLVKEFGKNS